MRVTHNSLMTDKPMALEFPIELEFRNVDFCGGRKTGEIWLIGYLSSASLQNLLSKYFMTFTNTLSCIIYNHVNYVPYHRMCA